MVVAATEMMEDLWNDERTENLSTVDYQGLLMEQYKVYVEVTDRFSARRSLIHTFFLTLHTLIIAIVGLSLSRSPFVPQIGLLLITLLGLLFLCYAWWRLVQYYRRSIRVKSEVIAELESRLPCNTAWSGEQRQQAATNNPLRRMETTLPILYALLYVLSYCYVAYLSL